MNNGHEANGRMNGAAASFAPPMAPMAMPEQNLTRVRAGKLFGLLALPFLTAR